MAPRHFLTKKEIAARWCVTVRTVERLVRDGKCPPVTRIGRRVLFGIEAVEAWERKKTAA